MDESKVINEIDPWNEPYVNLWQAARDGKMRIFQYFLNKGQDVEQTPNQGGSTALMMTAKNGHLQIAKLLLQHKANIEAMNTDRWTPLLYAINARRVEVAEFLISQGANIYATTRGWDAPSLAQGKGPIEDLVKKYFKTTKNTLWQIAANGTEEDLHIWMKSNELQLCVNQHYNDKDDKTALHFSAKYGNVDVARALILSKANIEACQFDGKTPLHIAICANQLPMVKLLSEFGANFMAQPFPRTYEESYDERETCLSFAKSWGGQLVEFVQLCMCKKNCQLCGKENALVNCKICKQVWYCDLHCQDTHLIFHMLDCENYQKIHSTIVSENVKVMAKTVPSKKRKCKAIVMTEIPTIIKTGKFFTSWLTYVKDSDLAMLPPCSRIGIEDEKAIIFCCEEKTCQHIYANSNDTMFEVVLENTMGQEIWDRFSKNYLNLACGKSLQRGYGNSLMFQVENIVLWYLKNKNFIDELCQVAITSKVCSPLFSLWQEFKIMWIDGPKSKQDKMVQWATRQDLGVVQWATTQDVGVNACLGDCAHDCEMFAIWKTLK